MFIKPNEQQKKKIIERNSLFCKNCEFFSEFKVNDSDLMNSSVKCKLCKTCSNQLVPLTYGKCPKNLFSYNKNMEFLRKNE